MGVKGDLIWGDDDESEVFAQAQTHDLCLIFRYSLHAKLPQSLPSRVANCFHCPRGGLQSSTALPAPTQLTCLKGLTLGRSSSLVLILSSGSAFAIMKFEQFARCLNTRT